MAFFIHVGLTCIEIHDFYTPRTSEPFANMPTIPALTTLDAARFDTPSILKRLTSASRKLAELKGIAASIPDQSILINALGLQEAKDSSEIENIVTTHDELFKDDVLPGTFANPAAKEVLRYRQALRLGYQLVRDTDLITANHLIAIQIGRASCRERV